MDTVNTVTCKKQNPMPKLKKNRRMESKWGVKYYTAVKNAVFTSQTPSYVPKEPPPSLKESDSEYDTLYMCAQCKDCFHFRNSLEDHIARKSWILGYWCQHCFLTMCDHSPKEGLLCLECVQLEHGKRSYLRSRGLHKSQKFGAVRIFYNQCQFFAHLKVHKVNLVDMGDIMLMPLSTNINHWSPDIDVTLEALMEHTFIMKVHIMDWLKDNNIYNNWLQLARSNTENGTNSVALVLKGYKGKSYFKPLIIPMEEQFSILNCSRVTSNNSNICSDIEMIDSVENSGKRKRSCPTNPAIPVSDKCLIENEDNPCTANDIAFVDCGSATKYFESESFVNNNRKKQTAIFTKSLQNTLTPVRVANTIINKSKKNRITDLNCVSPDVIMSYGNTMITPKRSTKDSGKCSMDGKSWNKCTLPVKIAIKGNIANVDLNRKVNRSISEHLLNVESSPKVRNDVSPCATKRDTCTSKLDDSKQNVHTLTVNSGQKIITFQGTKNVDINSIINQLPSHIVNNKKIVFIGQDSDVIAVHKQESSTKKIVQLVPDASLEEDSKASQTKTVVSFNSSSELLKSKSSRKHSTESMKSATRSISGKVVYQNGRRYIMKQSPSSAKNSKNISNAAMSTKGIRSKVQSKSVNNIPPLIPINSTELENLSNQERMNSLQGDVSPLTPSPSPSELSSSSSCDVQSKQPFSILKSTQRIEGSHSNVEHLDVTVNTQNLYPSCECLTFHKGEDENLYLDIKFMNPRLMVHTIVDSFTMITKCKQEMLNEFFHLPYPELEKRYEHLQQINDEVSRVMHFVDSNVVKENLKAVNILQHVLKHCIDKCSEKIDDTNEDTPLNEWETEYEHANEKLVCRTCKKVTKPRSYIPGFSKPSKLDTYCLCYKYICHKCQLYQGNKTRFVAHQLLHKKEKPNLCPDCFRKFRTFALLEYHTWTMCFHTLKKRVFGCKICEINGFEDMESIARHFGVMHSHHKIACDKCYVVLPSYPAYRKHHKEKHPNADDSHPIRLVLCKLGQCIVRCEEYMLHMEKHMVVQRLIWFKCPFCSFVNAEAKRVMSHLQGEHLPRLAELISPDVLWKIVSSSLTNAVQPSSKFVNAELKAEQNGTVMPKIINARTITSEVFERGAQIVEDYPGCDSQQSSKIVNDNAEPSRRSNKKMLPKILNVRSVADLTLNESKKGSDDAVEKSVEDCEKVQEIKRERVDSSAWVKEIKPDPDAAELDESIDHSLRNKLVLDEEEANEKEQTDTRNAQLVSMSKPPPLARIPRHVFQSDQPTVSEQATKVGKASTVSRNLKNLKIARRPHRIALNGSSKDILNFSCHLCGELIDTSQAVIKDHFEGKHSREVKLVIVTPKLLRVSSDFINGGYKDMLGNRKRRSENSVSNPKRRRRWTPKKHNESKNVNFAGLGLYVKPETAEDSEGNFRCKKCDQRCIDMANLREHIASTHRIRGRCLVCLECGDNFVVAPSLQMHLKAFHGIEDPITYMAQNTSYAPDNVDDLEAEGKSIEANQCHVCMAVFEDKAAVDKHLRVHGMAFLNRKRIEAQNALKSPEKKTETEEEKQTLVKACPKEPVRKDKPAETILEKISATI